MFAGIIEATGKIASVEMNGGLLRVAIAKPTGWKLTLGESVALDGICSTVIAHNAKSFSVEYMPETLRLTTAAAFKKGARVNLERSLALGGRISGHFVAGHVDATVRVVGRVNAPGRRMLSFGLSPDIAPYIAKKGSVAINGVALTVANVGKSAFSVELIPHTMKETSLGVLTVGDAVNVEADMLARYVAQALSHATVSRDAKKRIRKKRRSA